MYKIKSTAANIDYDVNVVINYKNNFSGRVFTQVVLPYAFDF